MIIDAECPGYLEVLDQSIEGYMTYVFSTWDNRNKKLADFECEDSCPSPAASCEDASVAFKDIKFFSYGSNWNPEPKYDENEEEEEDEPELVIGEPTNYLADCGDGCT